MGNDVPGGGGLGPVPEDLARALLDDPAVVDLLDAAGVSALELRVAIERRWLERLGAIDDAVLRGRRADVTAILDALNTGSPAIDGIPEATRQVLAATVRESAALQASRITRAHLLVALIGGRDPVVAPAAAELGLRAHEVRRIVARRDRRAG